MLGIGRVGVGSLEFIPKGMLLRFLQDSDMGNVLLREEEFGSLPDEPLEISASHQGKVSRTCLYSLFKNTFILNLLAYG